MARSRGRLTVAGMAVVAALAASPAAAGRKSETAFAVSLAEKGLWSEALHRFRTLCQKHPNNPRAWNNLAVALEAVGRYDEAHEAYQRAAGIEEKDLEEIRLNREAFDDFYGDWTARRARRAPPAAVDSAR